METSCAPLPDGSYQDFLILSLATESSVRTNSTHVYLTKQKQLLIIVSHHPNDVNTAKARSPHFSYIVYAQVRNIHSNERQDTHRAKHVTDKHR